MAKDNEKTIEAAKQIVRSQAEQYLKYPNINSVGIGYKIKDGKQTDEISIQFSVGKKASPEVLELLEDNKEIPKSFTNGQITIKTDVVERSFDANYKLVPEGIIKKDVRKTRLDPIKPGISVGHIESTAGTIGCIVYDNESGAPYILSNWHVLDGGLAQFNNTIVQPGPYDDSETSNNKLGKLVRSHLGVAGDCAVASINGRNFDLEVLDIKSIPEQIAKVDLGDKVIKSGRTTSVTHGIVSRILVTTKINYDNGGEQNIGGFEIVIDPANKPKDGEVSKGGDSGSLWLVKNKEGKPTNIAVGLHFAGESGNDQPEHALACYMHSVLEKLEVSLKKPAISTDTISKGNTHMGFKKDFLGFEVNLPQLSAKLKKLVAANGSSQTLDYTHFSVCMNKSRRIAFYTAVNIDGNSLKRIIRKKDVWLFDSRISDEYQCGNDIYLNNKLDRGHLVRRLDPCWGPDEIAKQAEKDTFYYTNAAPQHANLNQKTWNDLEDYLLNNTKENNLKISVFTGPVFNTKLDPGYRGIQIPLQFWKIVCMVKEDGKPSATGYILSQADEMDSLEKLGFVFGEYRTYQTSISAIESLTSLKFGKLKEFDPKAIQIESLEEPPMTYIDTLEKIVL